eukprot:3190258-Rhodomonas_salina.7
MPPPESTRCCQSTCAVILQHASECVGCYAARRESMSGSSQVPTPVPLCGCCVVPDPDTLRVESPGYGPAVASSNVFRRFMRKATQTVSFFLRTSDPTCLTAIAEAIDVANAKVSSAVFLLACHATCTDTKSYCC